MNPQEIYYKHTRPEVAELLPAIASGNILEVGCGAGTFASHLPDAAEYWGVEPVPSIAKEAEARLTRVFPGIYEDVESQLPDQHFDLVICNDVIEHMTDHDAFLTAIRKKMKPGAHIVGSIPNVRYAPNLFRMLFLKDWEYGESGTLDRTHFRFFTEKSLRNTFIRHGYAIEELKGINSLADVRETPAQLARAIVLKLLVALTLGHAADVPYQQFAFRIKTL